MNDKVYIVNGLGRCGTTVLYNSISQVVKAGGFVRNLHCKLEAGFVYKTHDYPPKDMIPKNWRAIFLFGNVYDIVMACMKIGNLVPHMENMHSFSTDKKDCMIYDTMRMEMLFDRWMNARSVFNVSLIRYESMFNDDTRAYINKFTGLNIKLPEYRPRKTKATKEQIDALSHIYGSLQCKVDSTPDVLVL